MRRPGKPSGAGAWLLTLAACAMLVTPGPVGAGDTQGAVAVCGADNGQPALDTTSTAADPSAEYIIGAQDKLSIQVFEVKELSLDSVTVDATGQIELPLIGRLSAAGKTPLQLQTEIAQRLGDRYLQSPQVSVLVIDAASQKVTVEGEVRAPGVFSMKGRTTLMQAIAMAGGPGDNADLHKVAVIRDDHGIRRAAVCDYESIRRGHQLDPELRGDDIVVVDGSKSKTLWSNALKALPFFTMFAYLR
jgi:polysaccharide export outer membrane protein